MQKPYLTLSVDADYVPYEVFVNGGFISTDLTGWTGSETWPINPWLRSGSNQLAVLLYPWHARPEDAPSFDPQAHLTLRVSLRDLASPAAEEVEVLRLKIAGAKLDNPELNSPHAHADFTLGALNSERVDFDGKLLLTLDLGLRLPFPEWAFLRSEPAAPAYTLDEEQIEPHYQRLLSAYENIWQLLQAKQLDELMPLFAERNREIDLAMYHAEGTTQAKLRESLERVLEDETRTLAPIRPEDGAWKYDVGPTGKLLRLSDGAQSSAIIRFPETGDPRASIGYGIAFRKQDDALIVAR
jgi:hypothetical protein